MTGYKYSKLGSRRKISFQNFLFVLLIFFLVVLVGEGIFYLYFKKQREKLGFVSYQVIPQAQKLPFPSLGVDRLLGEYTTEDDGIARIWVSAVITSSPYLKEGIYYFSVTFGEAKKDSQVEVILGRENSQIGYFNILNKNRDSEDQDSKTMKAERAGEIVPFLKPQILIRFQIPVGYNRDKVEMFRGDLNCDELCQENFEFLERYTGDNKEFTEALKNEAEIKTKIIGPIIQMEVLGEVDK